MLEESVDAYPITPGDRLGMTLFFAAVLHAVIVLGVSFDLNPRIPPLHSVEITLAQFEDDEAPEEADFLAQSNQQGSGTLEEKAEITMPEAGDTGLSTPEPLPQFSENQSAPHDVAQLTTLESERAVTPTDKEESTEAPSESQPKPNLLQKSLEIASLEAKFAEQKQAYAKRPRIVRVTAVSARQTSSAFYLENWRKELERIGNLNYPDEARRRRLQGNVRVLVALDPDGTIHEMEILQSSGYRILDDAVIRIIRLAAPFAPFTDRMRAEMDRLEIIRTFDFRSRLSSF